MAMLRSITAVALLWSLGVSAFTLSGIRSVTPSHPRSSRRNVEVRMVLDFLKLGQPKTSAKPSIKALKDAVFKSIEGSDMGRLDVNGSRKRTIEALQALAAANPTPDSATSPLAEGRWDLLWTTEDEIHTFRKGGLLGCACLDVFQETDQTDRKLENVIDFTNGSYLRITSDLKPQPKGIRVTFSWTNARLGYRGFEVPLPRFVQNAWYENQYLDRDVRVVKDVRGNWLIVQRSDKKMIAFPNRR